MGRALSLTNLLRGAPWYRSPTYGTLVHDHSRPLPFCDAIALSCLFPFLHTPYLRVLSSRLRRPSLSLQLYRLINPSVASHRSDCCKHAYTGLEGHSNLTLLAMTSLGLLEPNSAPAPLCLSARFADWNAP